MADILVVAELLEGKLRKTTLSALRFARMITEKGGGSIDIHAIGAGADAVATELAGFGARKIFATEIPGGYVAENCAATIADLAKKGAYAVVTATASTFGKDLLPRVAGKLGAGVASDIVGVNVDGAKIVYRRPMYAGNVFGYVEITTPVAVVTVRQSDFEPADAKGGSTPIEKVARVADPAAARVEFVKLESVKSTRPELTEAKIVVSGGRALKSAENFKTVLEPLVDALGAAMGASRAACDAGYVPNDLQVGQTGKVVAPALYLAIGISGAIQHLAGMKGSKVIVAVNKDKEAPIAQVADYFIVGDLFKVVPELTAEVKKVRAAG